MSEKNLLWVVLGLVAVAIIAYAAYSMSTKNSQVGEGNGDGAGQICTMEAKQCPDGSYVGRTGPNCEFAPCPGGATIDVNID